MFVVTFVDQHHRQAFVVVPSARAFRRRAWSLFAGSTRTRQVIAAPPPPRPRTLAQALASRTLHHLRTPAQALMSTTLPHLFTRA